MFISKKTSYIINSCRVKKIPTRWVLLRLVFWYKAQLKKTNLTGFGGFHEFYVMRMSTASGCPHQINIQKLVLKLWHLTIINILLLMDWEAKIGVVFNVFRWVYLIKHTGLFWPCARVSEYWTPVLVIAILLLLTVTGTGFYIYILYYLFYTYSHSFYNTLSAINRHCCANMTINHSPLTHILSAIKTFVQ